MTLNEFNMTGRDAAIRAIRPCLDVARWLAAIVDGRPYDSTEAVLEVAREAACPFAPGEIEAALAHHPRIGERARGQATEARMSAGEQAGIARGSAELAAGNAAYERKFGRIFLIRAAGRTSAEVLSELHRRIALGRDEELQVVADELRQIAALRLAQVLTP